MLSLRLQVDHELSVPAVTTMFISAGAWTVAALAGIMLHDSMAPRTLRMLGLIGAALTVPADILVGCTFAWFEPKRYRFFANLCATPALICRPGRTRNQIVCPSQHSFVEFQ